jgi:Kef-type K+ transport system membrane component KefB
MIEFNSLLILLLLIWLAGKLFRYLKFPVLFGELLVGVLVGPRILGVVQETEMITLMAEFGIFFLMLHEGLTNDPREIFKSSRKSILIGVIATVFPFATGILIGQLLGYDWIQSGIVGSFFGITAVTVSTRIFKDYKYINPKITNTVFTAGLVSDILAILIISVLFDIKNYGLDWSIIISKIALVLAFFSVTLWIGKRYFHLISGYFYKGGKAFTFTLIVAVAFALLAEQMGIKPVIGAFLAGLFIREDIISQQVYNKIEDRVYGLSYSFLAPIFFVSLAFHINLEVFVLFPVLLLVFVLGSFASKYLASYVGAIYSGLNHKDANLIALAMNSRGALELVMLALAEKEGLISKDIFSILIAASFITTLLSIILMKPSVRSRNQQKELLNG